MGILDCSQHIGQKVFHLVEDAVNRLGRDSNVVTEMNEILAEQPSLLSIERQGRLLLIFREEQGRVQ